MPFQFKLGACFLLALLLFGAGWAARGKEVQIVEKPVTVTKTQIETQVQTKVVDHVVKQIQVVTVHDTTGKVTETRTETDTEAKDTDKSKDIAAATTTVVQQPVSSLAQFGLGLRWQPRVSSDAYKPTAAELSYRVAGPVWGSVGFDWKDHTATVGVRVEW